MPKILTFKELREYGIIFGRRQLYRLEAEGKFPKRVRIGENSVGWLTKEIEAYVEEKINQRRT